MELIARLRWRGLVLLALPLFALLGCQTLDRQSRQEDVALINLWSLPGEPSLTFRLRRDRTLLLLKDESGRESNYRFRISHDANETLQATIKSAYDEIKCAQKIENIRDGANIRIVIGDNDNDAAIIRNYAQRFYNFKHVPVLFEKLKEIAPEQHWR